MQSTRTSKDNTSLETRPADHYHRFGDYKTLILSIMVLARPTYPPLPPPFFARVHNAQRTHTQTQTASIQFGNARPPWRSGLAMAMPATGLTRI